ncbi:T9SS type A sorting domain-containing protein [Namhaeicola litoreus]|uniref:T9SS type A sorting domain-containing protein n=1 Tax=Namhaeicola litoreus TaxID=1052145 RepID=A0ABW3Y6X1_9FLAO
MEKKVRFLFWVVCFLFIELIFAKTYYVSAGGSDLNDGLTESTAWQSLNKINSEMLRFQSGDVIAFRSGDEFYGTLKLTNRNGIKITSYGSGPKPVLTGAESLEGWQKFSNNLWVSTIKKRVNQVFYEGNVLQNARFPHIKDDFSAEENYLKVTKAVNNQTFISDELIGHDDITGAFVQIQSADWIFSSCQIKGFDPGSGRITLDKAPAFSLDKGDNFFIIDHVSLLDREGEWYYDKDSNKLFIYSALNPKKIKVDTSTGNGLDLTNSNNISIENISFNYYSNRGVNALNCDNLSIQNCTFLYCYEASILTKKCLKTSVINSYFKGGMQYCINLNIWEPSTVVSNAIVQGNEIFEFAMLKQATSKNFQTVMAISSHSKGDNISQNKIEKVGYCGIRLHGSEAIVENNFVKDFCLISHDGGGIKTGAPSYDVVSADGSIIRNNITVNRNLGDKWLVAGIYIDDTTKDVLVSGNTISESYWGVYLHNNKRISLLDNKIYNTQKNGLLMVEDRNGVLGEMKGNIVEDNQIFMLKTDETVLRIRNSIGDHFDFARMDNNKYYNPYYNNTVSLKIASSNGRYLNLPDWRKISNKDIKSSNNNFNWQVKNPEDRVRLIYNSEFNDKTFPLGAKNWEDLDGKIYAGNITLKPFSSVILFITDKSVGSIKAHAGEDINLCYGDSAILEASGGTSYKWSTGETSQRITVKPNSTTTYTVEVSNGSISDTDDVVVTVQPMPIANAGPDVTITEGDSATLIANGGDGYLWSTGETVAEIVVSPKATKTYEVIVTQNGCTAVDSVTVVVNSSTTTKGNANIADAGKDQTICAGNSATLTASGGTIFKWSTGETTRSITVNPINTTIYSVEVSDGTISDTDEVLVLVNELPHADAGPNVTIEVGESAVLYATGGDSYLWSTGENTSSIKVSPNTTTIYEVIVTKNGCTSIDSVTVVVNGSATTKGNVNADAGSDQSICEGASAILTASGGTSYKWSTGETSKSIIVNPNSTTTYSVEVSDGTISDTDEVVVMVYKAPKAKVGSNRTISLGETIVLTATGGDNYLWNTGETTPSISVSPSVTTIYSVVVSSNGCTSGDQVKVNVVKPMPPNAQAGEDLTICLGESIILNGSGGDEYLWSTGDDSPSITVSPNRTTTYTLNVTRGGLNDVDEVVVTVINCNLNNSVPDVNVVETKNNSRDNSEKINTENLDLLVYPNPTEGIINIQGSNSLKTYNLVLMDMQGNVISTDLLQEDYEANFGQIDLSRFAKGVYLMQLYNREEKYVEKVVVM